MAATKEQREIEIVLNGQKVNASLKEMGASAALMNNQLRKMAADDLGREKLKSDFNAMRDRISGMKQELYGVEKASLAAKLGFSDMGGFMKTVMGTAGGFLVGGGIEALVGKVMGFFGDSSTAAKDFEAALSSLSAITGATGEDLRFYEEQAQLIGETTSLSASQAVEAFKLIGSAKPELLGNKEALAAVTQEAIALAEAAGMELPEAANSLASSLNQFGAGADEAGRFINVLAAGAKEGSSEITETAAALKNAGTVASGAGLSFEQTNASIQALAEISIKGGEAGTGLRNVLLTLQSGADDTNPAVVGLETALDNLGKKNLSTAELAKLFGKENVVVANQMVNSREKISQLTEAMTGTSTAYEQAAINMDNLEGDMKSLDSATESLQIGIGKGLNVAIREGVKFLTSFVLTLKEAPKFVYENRDVFISLGVAILALNAANIRAAASTLAHNAVEKGRAIATRASAAAQWVLNAAMTANPIGLVIAAVAALVGGFVILYNRSEQVRAGVAGLGNAFMELLSIAGDIGSFLLNPLKNAGKLAEIKNAGERLGKAFSDGYNNKLAQEKAAREQKEASDQMKKVQDAAKTGESMGKAEAEALAASLLANEEKVVKAREKYNGAVANSEKANADLEGMLTPVQQEDRLSTRDVSVPEEDTEEKREAYFEKLQEEEAAKQEVLAEMFSASFDAEFQREQALLELKKATLEQKRNYLLKHGLLETQDAVMISQAILKTDKELAGGKVLNAEKTAKAKRELEKMALDQAIETFQAGIELLGKETIARRAAVVAFKAFSLGKIAIDLQEEIAAIWKTANQNPLNALIPGSGNVIAGVKTALAIKRSITAAKTVEAQEFAQGGMTRGGKTIPMTEVGGMWQMLNGHSGGSIGAFADGGWVNDAQLGLIGERGRELVIPNWMVESPKYANLVGYLEAERQKGIRAFADGGMTSGAAPALPVAEETRALTNFETQLLQEVREMKEEVAAWPSKLQVHNNIADTRDKLQQLNDLEEKAFG